MRKQPLPTRYSLVRPRTEFTERATWATVPPKPPPRVASCQRSPFSSHRQQGQANNRQHERSGFRQGVARWRRHEVLLCSRSGQLVDQKNIEYPLNQSRRDVSDLQQQILLRIQLHTCMLLELPGTSRRLHETCRAWIPKKVPSRDVLWC